MQRTSSLGASSSSTISPSRDGALPGSKSMFVGRGAPNFGEDGPLGGPGPLGAEGGRVSMAKKVQQRTVRSMASSVQVEGDRRQRVDVSCRLGLSLLPRCQLLTFRLLTGSHGRFHARQRLLDSAEQRSCPLWSRSMLGGGLSESCSSIAPEARVWSQ